MFRIQSLFQKKNAQITQDKEIKSFKEKRKKEQQKKIKTSERKQRLKDYIERAGFAANLKRLNRIFFNTAIIINLIISAFLIYYFSVTYGIEWSTVVASIFVLWVLIFILLIIAMWMIFYVAVDLRIFRRKVDIEEVLPDFLQLTASNINAGMSTDKALWYAVRPRFGVLANEIEIVAKETMSGVDLKQALEKFASRYDSTILKRAINMINESLEAGGSVGNLLNRVALDIQEQKSMFREMSANVTTYVIFIVFASVVAAPLLFALSGILIQVVESLGTSLGGTVSLAQTAGISISFSGVGVSQNDFKIFAITSLTITSFFSAIMVATIKKGNVKAGIKYVPIFAIVSFLFYIIIQGAGKTLLSSFLSF